MSLRAEEEYGGGDSVADITGSKQGGTVAAVGIGNVESE